MRRTRFLKACRATCTFVLVVAVCAGGGRPAWGINGSNSGSSIFNGVYVNDLIGADAFYQWGFGGSRAIVANIEAGAIWTGHESLSGRVARILADPTTVTSGTTQLGQADWHATMVGHALAGTGIYQHQVGIAPAAQLWSGAVATRWVGTGFTGGFSVTEQSLMYPYVTALRTGVASGTATLKANVINSSWGFTDSAGSDLFTIAVDALLRESNAVGVFAAGNDGPAANTVGSPASGYNGIAVAALTGDTLTPPYSQVATFSSRGPGNFLNPATQQTVANVRPVIDIAAPGDNLTLAFYGGTTGGNRTGSDPTGGQQNPSYDKFYLRDGQGTSFAAPIVAGGAALLVDAGTLFVSSASASSEMLDARVIKATMMASASAIAGWNNGQANSGGVITTTQALDPSVGAGMIDLDAAYRVYVGDPSGFVFGNYVFVDAGVNTTLGVSGTAGGSGLNRRGWDLGSVVSGTGAAATANAYSFGQPFSAGDSLSVALTWFAERTLGGSLGSALDVALANLSLEVWRMSPLGTPQALVAQSISSYGSSEFLRFTIPTAGSYGLKVVGLSPTYDLTGAGLNTDYGLAWNVVDYGLAGDMVNYGLAGNVVVVPEPATLPLAGIGIVCGVAWWRRRWSR